MTSIWHLGEVANSHCDDVPLPARVDVAVVGGGITGLTTALLLSERGVSVALLEARRIGEGNTGNSTGNLYATVSSGLAGLTSKWDTALLRSVVAARTAAVTLIRDIAARFEIACDLRDCDVHFCVGRDDAGLLRQLEAEAAATAAAGLAATLEPGLPGWPQPVVRQLRIPGQAQFNPLPYAQGLAQALRVRGVIVREQCRVTAVDASAGELTTTAGKLHADQLVFATHSPPGVNLVQAEMVPYREFGIAVPASPLPPDIVWMQGDSRSLRSFRHDGQDWLVVVGEKVKTGRSTDADYHERLASWAAGQLGGIVEGERWRWSAQQYKSADGLPYIGRSAHHNVFIATGFAADGLVWGTVAARLIADEIAARSGELARQLTPRRFTPVKSAQVWLSENATVAAELLRTALPGSTEELAAVAPGEGRIVEVEGERVAAYRSETGELSLLSSLCPHLKCRVAWNATDATWDCPCHGSRFDTTGAVIEGPAWTGLARREPPSSPAS